MVKARTFIVILMGRTLYIRRAAVFSAAEDSPRYGTADEASSCVLVSGWVYPDSRLFAASIESCGHSMNSRSDLLRSGPLRDFHMVADLTPRSEWQLGLENQVERWRFPLLSLRSEKNNAITFQLSHRPMGRTR